MNTGTGHCRTRAIGFEGNEYVVFEALEFPATIAPPEANAHAEPRRVFPALRAAFAAFLSFGVLAGAAHASGPYPLVDVVKVSTGYNHSCALLANGHVACWGSNEYGQLGDGTTTNRTMAVLVKGYEYLTRIDPADIVDVSAGWDHTCVLSSHGEVACWGRNDHGQSGGDPVAPKLLRPYPVTLDGNAVALSAGARHTCALVASHESRCWGADDERQLGDSSDADDKYVPVPMRTAYTFSMISAGNDGTCGVRTGDSSIVCWGGGWLGNGVPALHGHDPVSVQNNATKALIVGAVSVSVGLDNSCAVLASGEIWCWGSGLYGIVGDGTFYDRYGAVRTGQLTPLKTVIAASMGSTHACAIQKHDILAENGTYCWGTNEYGELGINPPLPAVAEPMRLPSYDFVDIAAGKNMHTCGATRSGSALCWGFNGYGQVGDGTNEKRSTPTAVYDADKLFIDGFEVSPASGL